MQDIFNWIDEHRDELVAELQELLRQPSISAQKVGLAECAELLRRRMIDDGFLPIRICPYRHAVDCLHHGGRRRCRRQAAALPTARRAAPEPLDKWIVPLSAPKSWTG
ncbi:MAG: hypothetical protein R2873_03900 [Caldilineaceae bacterium]